MQRYFGISFIFSGKKGLSILIAGCLMAGLSACCSSKSTLNAPTPASIPNTPTRQLTVITDTQRNTLQLSFAATDTLLAEAAKQPDLSVLLGVLNINHSFKPVSSVLTLNGWEVPLTDIRVMEARSPAPIVITPQQIGKLALVQGYFNGATLYQANIIAVFSDTPLNLLYQLLNKNCPDISPYLLPGNTPKN